MRLINWTISLATHSGKYGTGNKILFDWPVYKNSFLAIVRAETLMVKLFIFSFLIYLSSLFFKFFQIKKRQKIILGITAIVSITTSLIFAKFNRSYYQIAHLFIFISLLVLVFNKSKNLKPLILISSIILAVFLMPKRISTHLNSVQGFKKLAFLEEQIASSPPKHMTLWEYGNTKDFSLIWGRSWSGEFYGSELSKLYPHLGEMVGFKHYRSNKPETFPLFDVCWDQLYIQTSSLSKLQKNFPEIEFNTTKMDYGSLILISSDHCKNMK